MAVISKKTALVWVIIVAGAVTLWKFVWKPMEMKNETAPDTVRFDTMPSNTKTTAAQSPSTIGVKSAMVRTSYKNPGGEDAVSFSISVNAEGIITAASTDILATNEISKMRQKAFADGLPAALQGKKLSELSSIDKVGGSSLTTKAFNEALPQLKAQL